MKLKITVDNRVYEVEVEAVESDPAPPAVAYSPVQVRPAPLAAAVAPAAPVPPSPPANEDKVCRSPINGIVNKILVQPGQRIQPGDKLLVLEAMKMETNITAPVAGVIAKVNVNVGDSVQANQILIEFE